MVFLSLLLFLAAAGATFGVIAAIALRSGSSRARTSAAMTAAVAAGLLAISYSAYLVTKRGAAAPADFLNSVAGQLVVFSGLLFPPAVIVGCALAFVLLFANRK